MKKAYCTFPDLSEAARSILTNAESGVDLTVSTDENQPNGAELLALLKEYDILILGVFSKLTAEMLQEIDRPKIIATRSVGLDRIDEAFLRSDLVTIINIKDSNARSVAEHIFALILALNKRICEANRLVVNGEGHRSKLQETPEDITGKTLGLIGAGTITQEVIKIAQVFNLQLKCFTKDVEQYLDLEKFGVEFLPFHEVITQSDIINVSIPLNSETKHFISSEIIALMKPTATFINTSRTEVVDNQALIAYAQAHETFYVGLDIDVDHDRELFMKSRNNVIVTPHIAGTSKQALARMYLEIANKVAAAVSKW